MQTDFSYIIWIPGVLLASFLVVGLFGNKLKPMLSGAIATLAILLGMVLSYSAAFQYFLGKGLVDGTYQTFIPQNWEWLRFYDTLVIKLGVMIDPISIMMLVVVTTISSMVHIYSFGYMKGEQGFERFYAYLSLFSFSMIGLVIATNIFQMYIFWELVGVSSFLLIGFYYTIGCGCF